MKTYSRFLSIISTVLFCAISQTAGAADLQGFGDLSQDQGSTNSAGVIDSVSRGLFYDSTGASKSMMQEGYSDVCYNLEGTQTELPVGYTMVRPGYCRKPCAPVTGTTTFLTRCGDFSSKTGYIVNSHPYALLCTGPYGTRSLSGDAGFPTTSEFCTFKGFSGPEFVLTDSLEDKGTTVNYGVQIAFVDDSKNKYFTTQQDLFYVGLTSYKSCNSPYRIREVIVGKKDSIQPAGILGTTVSNYWYKSSISDSNCTKVNFAGELFLVEDGVFSKTFDSVSFTEDDQKLRRLTLRGINQSKKTPAEAENGYQITLFAKSGQQVVYCIGKYSTADSKWNHYSGCKDRTLHENTPKYVYTTGYAEPVLPPPPAQTPAGPDPEPFDPYESPEFFAE